MKADSAQFNVHNCFTIPSRQWFILAGSVASGVVNSGMVAQVPLNSAFSIPLLIDSVEYIDRKDGSLIGLTYKYEDEGELEILVALGIEDELITIEKS